MGILLCEKKFRNVWIRNESVREEIGQILRTHTRGSISSKDYNFLLIWRPSRVADTPPLLPISRYGYRLFVADVCLCSEVLQPGCSWSSSGSGSM